MYSHNYAALERTLDARLFPAFPSPFDAMDRLVAALERPARLNELFTRPLLPGLELEDVAMDFDEEEPTMQDIIAELWADLIAGSPDA